MENKHEMYIDNKKKTSEHFVKLLSIEIDNQLNFDNNVPKLCKKAGSELNAIGRLRKHIGFPEINKQNRINTKKSPSTAI